MYSRRYKEGLNKASKEYRNNVGFGNQLKGTSIMFFGSYFSKKFGSYFTDLDIVEYITLDNAFFLRLLQILKNIRGDIPRYNIGNKFKFIRLYCGYKKGLEIPWDLMSDKKEREGTCDFSIYKTAAVFQETKRKYPEIYSKISPYWDKDTISVKDILTIQNILKPINSITWNLDEIIDSLDPNINRKKIVDGIGYDFKEVFIGYPMYRVFKFLYKYGNKWCLLDLNYRSEGVIKRDFEDIITFYENDVYKKFKYLKNLLSAEERENYKKKLSEKISHITPLAGRLELIKICKKYKTLDEYELKKLENEAKIYAQENNIPTIDYDTIQNIILEKIRDLYDYFKTRIDDKYKIKYFIYETRLKDFTKQIPKTKFEEREKYLSCPFFDINIENLELIFKKAVDMLLDPQLTVDCIDTVCKKYNQEHNHFINSIFDDKDDLSIKKISQDTYGVFEKDVLKYTSPDLKKIQVEVLLKKSITTKNDFFFKF
jgi:hypothetical protein